MPDDFSDPAAVQTAAFDQANAYLGDDLGAFCLSGPSDPPALGEPVPVTAPTRLSFKLWAPTASSVSLQVFTSAKRPDAPLKATHPMSREERGVWSLTLSGDGQAAVPDGGLAYDYLLVFPDGRRVESADPYARAATCNGDRSVLLDARQTALPGGASPAPKPAFDGNPAHAVVAEAHVRDFTSDPSSAVPPAARGKFLGLVEAGTTNAAGQPTGLDYLRWLGITHLQLMPFFDYGSVDEASPLTDDNYNWGYDPKNYNVPEGSYASDPVDPATRVVELKRMIDGLHRAGIRVVMDVVYNHVFDVDSHPFALTVPGYYFRHDAEGRLTDDSGCGNDIASERVMARKYIVDSVTYWAREYGIDGFRFDLMGLIDSATMNAVRAALNQLDPTILVFGEGWDMATASIPSLSGLGMTTQPRGQAVWDQDGAGSGVGFFNDSIRDGLRGSILDDWAAGYLQGAPGWEPLLVSNLLGCPYRPAAAGVPTAALCGGEEAQHHMGSPAQEVHYAEIHDNLTLYDKLRLTRPGDSELTRQRRSRVAAAAVLLAQGQPEFQVGQEFGRTKNKTGDVPLATCENSYRAGDSVNSLDWDRLGQAPYADSAAFVRGLIALRRSVGAFTMSDYETIATHSAVLQQSDGVVALRLSDPQGSGDYILVLNAADTAARLPWLAAGTYQLLVDDARVLSTAPLLLGSVEAAVEAATGTKTEAEAGPAAAGLTGVRQLGPTFAAAPHSVYVLHPLAA